MDYVCDVSLWATQAATTTTAKPSYPVEKTKQQVSHRIQSLKSHKDSIKKESKEQFLCDTSAEQKKNKNYGKINSLISLNSTQWRLLIAFGTRWQNYRQTKTKKRTPFNGDLHEIGH